MIEQQCGEHIVELRHEFCATILAPEIAVRLDAESNNLALVVIAQYFNDRGHLVQASVSTHPAERFSYVGTFKRGWHRKENEPSALVRKPRANKGGDAGRDRPHTIGADHALAWPASCAHCLVILRKRKSCFAC